MILICSEYLIHNPALHLIPSVSSCYRCGSRTAGLSGGRQLGQKLREHGSNLLRTGLSWIGTMTNHWTPIPTMTGFKGYCSVIGRSPGVQPSTWLPQTRLYVHTSHTAKLCEVGCEGVDVCLWAEQMQSGKGCNQRRLLTISPSHAGSHG